MSRSFNQFGLLITTALIMAACQLFLKLGTRESGALSFSTPGQILNVMRQIITSPLLLLGYGLSLVTSMLWLVTLSRLDLSYAGPMLTAIYYVFLLLSSALLLRESVTPWRWIGALLIVAGGLLILNTK
jgi:drug/metabolite transporter (DMT)-like permease